MTFMDSIDRLTIETHIFIDRDDGKHLVKRPGLLPQLREAVFVGMETGGGAGGRGSRPPIDAAARDLLTEIERQVAEALVAATKRPLPYGHAENYVRLWAAAADESTMVTLRTSQQHPDELVDAWRKAKNPASAVYFKIDFLPAWRVAARWVDSIEAFFNPPSTREIQGACPACEETHVHRVKDGATVQSAALTFLRNEAGDATEARCAACKAVWYPAQFEWLARQIGAKPILELASEK